MVAASFRTSPPRATLAWCVAALAVAPAGCGDDDAAAPPPSVAPPAATVVTGEPPATLDPARATTLSERAIAHATHTPLLTYRRSHGPDAGRLAPALARELPELSDDEREYRFSLRPGLLYADGRLVTASDVERAIAHASRAATNRDLRDALAAIEGAPSDDGQTLRGVRSDDVTGNVVIRLRRPDGRVPFALADPATAPLPELPSGEAQEPSTSTGPLRVARRDRAVVELVANPLRASIREVPATRFQRISLVPRSAGRAGGEREDLDLVPRRTAADGAAQITAPAGPTWVLAIDPGGALSSRASRAAVAQALEFEQLPEATPWPPSSNRAGLRSFEPACGVIAPYVVGAVDRDPCPPGPATAAPSGAPGALAAGAVVLAAPASAEAEVVAPLATAALVANGAQVARRQARDPLAELASGAADAALVRVQPGLPHPALWTGQFGVIDALVAREVPRLTRGPLTGSAPRWAAIDRRLVDRFTVVPIATERRVVEAGPRIDGRSVLLHPVSGIDLAALAPR